MLKSNRLYFLLLIAVVSLTVACVKDRVNDAGQGVPGITDPGDRTLIHYWDFNEGSLTVPVFSEVGGARLEMPDVYDDTEGSGQNLRLESEVGQCLRVRNPSTYLVIRIPTTGYRDPLLTFSVMRTNNGAQENIIEYTLDGEHYMNEGLPGHIITIMTDWNAYSFDFSHIEGADNNPDFAVRIRFNIGNENESGNNRYDNISVDGIRDSATEPEEPTEGDAEVLHYWNFNSSSDLLVPSMSIGGASLTYSAVFDDVNEGTELNARYGDAAGRALRLRNPSGDFFISIPTTGYKDVVVKYAVMRTGNGARGNKIFYTLDGTHYTDEGIAPAAYDVTESFGIQVLDFTSLEGVVNNPDFGIKIEFFDGHDNPSGNNRYDNLTVEGKKM